MNAELRRTVCAIDCGTTSVRASIAEIGGHDQALHLLEELERPLDLTHAFHGGILSRQVVEDVVSAFGGIHTVALAYGVKPDALRAVATSALREAVNADAVVERVLQRTGIELEVIDSSEEARLYALALTELWRQCQRPLTGVSILMMDVGSGATVTSLISDGKLVHSVDEHFGTIRVFDQFQDLKDHTDFVTTVDRFTHGAVRMMLRRLPREAVNQLVVTGGEMRQLARILHPDEHDSLPILGGAEINQWYEAMRPLSRVALSRILGCDAATASRLVLVACLLRNLMAETGLDAVTVPTMRLRDGMLAEHLPGSLGRNHLDRNQVLAMARTLGDRFGMDAAYSENTASLATQIFDQTVDLHHFGERERILLEFAAMVHDIGAYINVRNRHKHSMYLLHSVDLPGLDPIEVEIVAHVVRYHRRAAPRPNHYDFQALPRSTRVRVTMLAAILRLAYGLDVERTQRVRRVHCEVNRGRLLMRLDRRQIALERWSIAGKAQMLEEVFGLSVVLLPRQED